MSAGLRARLKAHVGQLELEVAFETGPGTLVLVGPNGAGKSSVLKALLGVLPVESGQLEVGGVTLFDSSASIDVPVEQRRLGYVPQHYALFPHLSVRGNVEFAVRSAQPSEPRRSCRARADELLAQLGLGALAERRPGTLSGGERQRVALARALAVRPRALLLDEPLAALDVHARKEVRASLGAVLERLALPTLVVSHDPQDARQLGQRIGVLESGRLTRIGTWEELVEEPRSHFVSELVGVESELARSAKGGASRRV